MERIVQSYREIDTYQLGVKLGKQAKPGDILCLTGDLGTGKTALAKGIAAGLDIGEDIVSPTFTILHEYSGRFPLYHFDVYRLEDGESLWDIGFDEYLDRGGVCLIEWADQISEYIPKEAQWLPIEKDLSRGTEYRKITIRGGNDQ